MPHFLLETFPKVLCIKKLVLIIEFYLLKYIIENSFIQEYVIISPRWVSGELSNTFLSYVILRGRWVGVKGNLINVTK